MNFQAGGIIILEYYKLLVCSEGCHSVFLIEYMHILFLNTKMTKINMKTLCHRVMVVNAHHYQDLAIHETHRVCNRAVQRIYSD